MRNVKNLLLNEVEVDRLKNNSKMPVIVVGSSTGGPKALEILVKNLPDTINNSIFIVQHMPVGFTKLLADRLNKINNINVVEATDKMIVRKNHIYIAKAGEQLLIDKLNDGYVVRTENYKGTSGLRPSVDVTFESIVDNKIKRAVFVILTGMGADGLIGATKAKKNIDVKLIAQDRATSEIYGMPRVVIEKGLVDVIAPIGDIASEIVKVMEG